MPIPTRHHLIGCALALLMSLGATGCGDDITIIQPEQTPYQSYSAQVASIVCQASAGCGCFDDEAVAECVSTWTWAGSYFQLYLLGTYPGLRFDPIAADACLAEAEAVFMDCPSRIVLPTCLSEGSGLPPSPWSMFAGGQEAGEPCFDTIECVAGLACDTASFACVTAAAENENCEYVDCEDGLVCWDSGTSKACRALQGEGEDCTMLMGSVFCPNGSCDRDICVEGLVCARENDVAFVGTCSEPHPIGEFCDRNSDCVDEAYCDIATNECVARLADGEDCDSPDERTRSCVSEFCTAAGTCSDPGICGNLRPPIL